eukprot:c22537_g1_i2 orf=1-234(-)
MALKLILHFYFHSLSGTLVIQDTLRIPTHYQSFHLSTCIRAFIPLKSNKCLALYSSQLYRNQSTFRHWYYLLTSSGTK